MTASEIIMAMVNGLKNPHTIVNMSTYGNSHDDVCYGCAATNAICDIMQSSFKPSEISTLSKREKKFNPKTDFLYYFERAIDSLRKGGINGYNFFAEHQGFARIENPNNIDLPELTTEDYFNNLEPYIQLAKDNEKQI